MFNFMLLLYVADRAEMLTQLVLGWTALLSGLQLVAPSVTTRKYKRETESTRPHTIMARPSCAAVSWPKQPLDGFCRHFLPYLLMND